MEISYEFKVNRKASSILSSQQSNNGDFDNAKHYRYEDQAFLNENEAVIKEIIAKAFSIETRDE